MKPDIDSFSIFCRLLYTRATLTELETIVENYTSQERLPDHFTLILKPDDFTRQGQWEDLW